jgi:hypothetical protein
MNGGDYLLIGVKEIKVANQPDRPDPNDIPGLELPSIGWQLFILGSSQSDSTAFLSSLDT